MKKDFQVENRLEHNYVFSNLVYPIEYGYYYDVQVDEKWLKDRLWSEFGKRDLDIANKYAIILKTNSGNNVIIVNHDGKYYTLNKENKKQVNTDDLMNIFNK